MKTFIVVICCLGLAGCGGEGSSIGSSDIAGSAVLRNFIATSSTSNICRNYVAPTDSSSCAIAGGSWSTRNAYTSSIGDLDGSYNAVCSSGTPNIKCNVGEVGFLINGTPSATSISLDHINSCMDAGGSIATTCSSISGTEDYCDISMPTNSADCLALGGTFHSSLKSATGSISNERLIAGPNTIQIAIQYPDLDTVDVLALNPQSPVYFTYEIKINDYFGNTFWTSSQIHNTDDSFGVSEGYDTFSFMSSVAADEEIGRLVIDVGTIYFQ